MFGTGLKRFINYMRNIVRKKRREIMSEEINPTVETAPPEEWNDVSFIVEDGSGEKIDQEALLKQLEDKQKELDRIKEEGEQNVKVQNTNDVIAESLKKMSENLNRPAPPVQPDVKEKEELDIEELNKQFFDNPVESVKKYLQHQYEDKIASLKNDILASNLNASKRDAMKNPEYEWIFKEHGAEIEQLVALTSPEVKMQMGIQVYNEAAERVIQKHKEEWKASIIQNFLNNQKKEGSTESTPPHTETGGGMQLSKPNGKKQVKITPEIQKDLDRAARLGMDRTDYYRRVYGQN
jgi:hypothetical protein